MPNADSFLRLQMMALFGARCFRRFAGYMKLKVFVHYPLTFSKCNRARFCRKLRKAGLSQAALLSELQLTEPYRLWREENQTYRGKPRPRWTWERVLSTARELKEIHGYLPTMDWFRENGYHGLIGSAFHHGSTWEGLREILGCFHTSHFVESRNGMRWRSQPEACLSDFLHARGIEHRRGERYDESYSASQSLRKRGQYDVHFLALDDRWIDVEIWGDGLGAISGGKIRGHAKDKRKMAFCQQCKLSRY